MSENMERIKSWWFGLSSYPVSKIEISFHLLFLLLYLFNHVYTHNNKGMIPCGFHAYNQLFMATQPKFRCFIPELDADPERNLTDQFIRNLTFVNYFFLLLINSKTN